MNKYIEQLNKNIITLKDYIQGNVTSIEGIHDKLDSFDKEISDIKNKYIAIVGSNKSGGSTGGDNIYTVDGTLAGARTMDQDGNKLSLMNGDLQLGDYPNTRDDAGVTYSLGTQTETAGMTAGGGATFSGTYTGGASTGYIVEVYNNKGVKWKWSENGGSPNIVGPVVTGSPTLLSNGISVTFNGAGTGYTFPAALSAPIDTVGSAAENFLYTDIDGNVQSSPVSAIADSIDTLYTADGTLTGDRFVDQDGNAITFFVDDIFTIGSYLIEQFNKGNALRAIQTGGKIISSVSTSMGSVNGNTATISARDATDKYNIISAYARAMSNGDLIISGTNSVQILTPLILNSTATLGQSLVLADAVTGEVEYANAAAGVLPAYATTALAAADVALTTGMFFKVTNADGTSAIHVKD